jgi:hypothetical protein
MSFFSRRSTSATKVVTEKDIAPVTSEVKLAPPEGTVPTKKWEYTPEQLEHVSQRKR